MKPILPLLLAVVSLSACAQAPDPAAAQQAVAGRAPDVAPGSADARALAAIAEVNPELAVDRVGPAPIAGFREVLVGGQTVYVSDDGRYLMQGSLFDIQARRDLSEDGMAALRRELLAIIPESDRIVFAPDKPVHTVAVFTDVECGYCRRLHREIAEYNRRGIAIEYLAFPRMGPGSEDFRTMISVWCAPDRRKALTDAKNGASVPPRTCTSPVAMQYDIGLRMGLTGTPMIVTRDGQRLAGYLPPDQLRKTLDEMAADSGG